MTAVLIFVFGVLLLLGLAAGRGRRVTGDGTYSGETINKLITTVDRVFRRKRIP